MKEEPNGSGLSDDQLWAQLKGNDQNALNIIYLRYIRTLYNYGYKIGQDKALVEDAIQDIFVSFWEKRQELSDVQNVESYLFKSLKRKLIREISRTKKRMSVETANDMFYYEFPLYPSIQSKLIAEEEKKGQQAKLAKALEKLTPRQREAIFLKYEKKMSFAEVADIMEIETKAIYKLMSRAIGALRESMELSVLACISLLSEVL